MIHDNFVTILKKSLVVDGIGDEKRNFFRKQVLLIQSGLRIYGEWTWR